jgi:MFS transporter, DHA2 family, methylenomycin A resistance protein
MAVDDDTTPPRTDRSGGHLAEAGPPTSSVRQRLGLAGLCLGTALIIMEANELNVAIPSIRHALHASPVAALWIIDAYTVVLAGLLLSAGRLSDSIGARRGYLLGLTVFSIASVLCSAATTSTELIAARTVQGVGAALLIPAPLALISTMFSDLTARAKAVALWVTVGAIGFAAGPIVGGLLVNTLGWRSIFVLNIPIAAMIGVVVHLTVGEASRSALPFDYVGQILALVGVSAVVFACVESSVMAWTSPFVLLPGVAAALILGLFVIDQRRRGPRGRLGAAASRTADPALRERRTVVGVCVQFQSVRPGLGL